jgi:phosphoglycolate phosphatase
MPAAALEEEIQAVHRKRRTTEYSHLLNELPALRAINPNDEPLVFYDEAGHVLNSARTRETVLYPGVETTLLELRCCILTSRREAVLKWEC